MAENLGVLNKRRLYTIQDNREPIINIVQVEENGTIYDKEVIEHYYDITGIEDSNISPNEDDVLITIPTHEKVFSAIYKYYNNNWQYQTHLSYPTVQGDWEQTEQTAPDYIWNKPQFESIEESVEEVRQRVSEIKNIYNNSMVIEISGSLEPTGYQVKGIKQNNTITFAPIPLVSVNKAGLFSSDDYNNLMNLLTWNVPGGKFRGVFESWNDVPELFNTSGIIDINKKWLNDRAYTGDYFIVKNYTGNNVEDNINSLYVITNNWKTQTTIGKNELEPSFRFTQELDIATEDKAGLVKSSLEQLKINFVDGIGELNGIPDLPSIMFIEDDIDIPISPDPPSESTEIFWYAQLKKETFDYCIKEIYICNDKDAPEYGNIYEVK